ncbi:MAG: hypothetical protein AAFP04_14010, partial [Myxococcota bacterium]
LAMAQHRVFTCLFHQLGRQSSVPPATPARHARDCFLPTQLVEKASEYPVLSHRQFRALFSASSTSTPGRTGPWRNVIFSIMVSQDYDN